MKVKVCDICYYESKRRNRKLVESTWRIGKKNGATAFRIDVCDKHKDWMKDMTLAEAEKRYDEIVLGLPDIKDVHPIVIGEVV